MYYNKQMFEDAGIAEQPATWDALKEAAAKIDALGDDVYGFGIQGKEIETDAYWYYALWTHGGNILEDGKSGIASDAGIEAAKLYKSMIDEGLTQPGVTGYSREGLQDLFKQGRLGILLTGPWLRGQMAAEAPDIDYGIAPIPEATTKATYGVTDSIIIFSSSEVKDAAWKFLEARSPTGGGASSPSRRVFCRCSSRSPRIRTSPMILSWRRSPRCCPTPSSRRSSPTGRRWRTRPRARCSGSIWARRRPSRRWARRRSGSMSCWRSKRAMPKGWRMSGLASLLRRWFA
jgi:hypothetical protein